MRQIKEKIFPTGKKCRVCGTEITEHVSLKNGNDIAAELNIKFSQPMIWVGSDYIGCPECSIHYGKPGFTSILEDNLSLKNDLRWELALYEVKIKKIITDKDIIPTPKNGIPGELKDLKVGDIIFIDHSGVENDLFIHCVAIRILKRRDAPIYVILSDCFDLS